MKPPFAPDTPPQRTLLGHLAEAAAIFATLLLCAAVGGLWAIIEGALS